MIVALVLGWAATRFLTQQTRMETDARETIRNWIFTEYAHQIIMPALKDAGQSEKSADDLLSRMERLEDIRIQECRARLTPEGEYIVRVKFSMNGYPPPDGRNVRYFVIRKFLNGKWFVDYETRGWQFYIAFF